MQAYIHTYIHTYIRTYIYTCIQEFSMYSSAERRSCSDRVKSSLSFLHRRSINIFYTVVSACMYIYLFIFIYIYLYLFVCMYVCMYVCIYVYIYVYVCVLPLLLLRGRLDRHEAATKGEAAKGKYLESSCIIIYLVHTYKARDSSRDC